MVTLQILALLENKKMFGDLVTWGKTHRSRCPVYKFKLDSMLDCFFLLKTIWIILASCTILSPKANVTLALKRLSTTGTWTFWKEIIVLVDNAKWADYSLMVIVGFAPTDWFPMSVCLTQSHYLVLSTRQVIFYSEFNAVFFH